MTKGIVKRIKVVEVEYRRKFDAKIAPTQLYQDEKNLVVQAVKEHEFDSISGFCREAVREKLERMGYPVPPESDYVKSPELSE